MCSIVNDNQCNFIGKSQHALLPHHTHVNQIDQRGLLMLAWIVPSVDLSIGLCVVLHESAMSSTTIPMLRLQPLALSSRHEKHMNRFSPYWCIPQYIPKTRTAANRRTPNPRTRHTAT